MAVKTSLAQEDFAAIFSNYTLGDFVRAQAMTQGTVQTNYRVTTTRGPFVLRYYENRSLESVRFECHLLAHLKEHHYPCPAPHANQQGKFAGLHRDKPFVLFDFLAGQHIQHLTAHHNQQIIQKAAELHLLTEGYQPPYKAYRWNYTPDLCRTLARAEADKLSTPDAHAKFAWLDGQLAQLQLPPDLPMGVCHCDFDLSNILFRGDQFAALLDFDDANYTWLLFDLVGLIEGWAWHHTADRLDFVRARAVVQMYEHTRPLRAVERRHLFDVYKLSILIDCVWFFGRGGAADFYERRKIESLDGVGREKFITSLFGK